MQSERYKCTSTITPSPKTNRGQASFIDVNQSHILYFNGNTIILHPLLSENPILTINHTSQVNCAKFSHDGKLVASLDAKGTLFIHQITLQKVIQTKVYENLYCGGKGIDWTSDRKRLCVVGSGKNQFGRVISVQTGTNVGEITGVSANLNAVCFHPKKNSKLVVGGDEYTIKYYEGPPYKFNKSKNTHTGYINAIKYSPNGQFFVSVGSDRRLVIYNGQNIEKIAQKQNAHNGSILGVDWINEQFFVTCSMDKCLIIWDTNLNPKQCIETGNPQQMKNIGLFQKAQAAIKYMNDKLYVVLMNGDILIYQKLLEIKSVTEKANKSLQYYRNKPIQTLQISQHQFMILDNYGRILIYNWQQRCTYSIEGQKNIKLILGGCCDGVFAYILLGDNTILHYEIKTNSFCKQTKIQGSKIINSCIGFEGFISVTNNTVELYKQGKQSTVKIDYQPTATSMNKQFILVGSQKGEVNIYNHEMMFVKKLNSTSNKITCIKIHCNLLIVGDSMGKISIWQWKQFQQKKIVQSLGNHTSTITSISIKHNQIITFGLDNRFNIWSLQSFKRQDTLNDVHKNGILHGNVINDRIVTCGGDLLIKMFASV